MQQTMKTPILSVSKKDLIRQTFRSGGKGGQNQNKVESGVRFIHEPSGARGESREYRTQLQNERAAFNRLATCKIFQKWLKVESARKMGQRIPETPEEIRERVNRQFDEEIRNGQIVIEEIDED
jgi:protein subunit release factor B